MSEKPPKTPLRDLGLASESQIVDADAVADQIEAGYDIQSDAATKPMASDPGSSSEDEVQEDAL